MASSASADTYTLNVNNAGMPVGDYLQVDITADVYDIDFSVDALDLAFTKGSNFGIQAFSFNVHPDVMAANSFSEANFIMPDGWGCKQDQNVADYGKFDMYISGTGSTRQDPLNFSLIDIVGDTPGSYYYVINGENHFAAHVADFVADVDGTPVSSAWFSDVTEYVPPNEAPLPAAAWLLCSGLAGLGGLRHRIIK